MPLVSIVTCTYNRAHLIGETIQSVLQQSFQDFEYIIVDDGSQDDTKSVVDSFADSRITYYYHERTGGHLARLRNFANSKCQGEFIAYIDSDDIWQRDKLQRQVTAMMENPSIGFSFTDIELFDKEKTLRSGIYGKSGTFTGSVFQPMLANELIICHTTLVIRKSSLAKTGPMDESMHSGDHDLVFHLSKLFDAFVIYEPLVRVRKHDQNSTSNLDLFKRLAGEHQYTLEKLFKRNLITKKEYQKAFRITCYAFGIQLTQQNDYRGATKYFLMNLKRRPWHLKSWVRLAFALANQKVGF